MQILLMKTETNCSKINRPTFYGVDKATSKHPNFTEFILRLDLLIKNNIRNIPNYISSKFGIKMRKKSIKFRLGSKSPVSFKTHDKLTILEILTASISVFICNEIEEKIH